MAAPLRIAVLASGGGSNLQALLDDLNADPQAPARVALVVGSRAGIGALERAERAGVPAMVLSAAVCGADAWPERLLEALEAHAVEMVVLAGYLQLVPPEVVRRFAGRILNIHPALLPAFGGRGMYGRRVHEAVLAAGARVTGATVHLVDERYDEGAIVAQWPVPVLQGDTPESLAARVLPVEHRLLPAAVRAFAGGGGPGPMKAPAAFELIGESAPLAASVARLAAPLLSQQPDG